MESEDNLNNDSPIILSENIEAKSLVDITSQESEHLLLNINKIYDHDKYVSKPLITEDSGIPINLATLHHSFGYDSYRRDNLGVLSDDTLCYISGNYLEIINIQTKDKYYLRSCSGSGIACLDVHPNFTHIALGEVGNPPMICIYTYPELNLVKLLRDGTKKSYASIKFDPTGELLASIGCHPDFMITIWNWKEEKIVLRSKAFSQDIYRVAWSSDLVGILNTAGSGHIRFWKMAGTFTGLKLQGAIGRFGKTELSDIEGFVCLPDGKVLSGSEWGNLLVWDGGLIKVQISRSGKRACHTGNIMQIIMDEGELMTIGFDGWIKTWDFETIDTAESQEEGILYELDPMNELCVKNSAKLMYMVKSPQLGSSEWFAQDANGSIWRLDLSFTHTSKRPEEIVHHHSDSIFDVASSPFTHTCATIGKDGYLIIYDIIDRKMIARHQFTAAGSRLIWNPIEVDPRGKSLLSGFADGVIRVVSFTANETTDPSLRTSDPGCINLVQALKPHTKEVTAMSYDPHGEYLATGSDDCTVFFFHVHSTNLTPIGFIRVPQKVRQLQWKEEEDNLILVIFMKVGMVQRVTSDMTNDSYELHEEPIDSFKFKSITALDILKRKQDKIKDAFMKTYTDHLAFIKRRLDRADISEEEAHKQMEELEKERKLMEKDVNAMLPELFPDDNDIFWGLIDSDNPNKFWLSMSGKDASYFMDCTFPIAKNPKPEIIYHDSIEEDKRCLYHGYAYCEPNKIIQMDGLVYEIVSTTVLFSQSGRRFIMGTSDGSIWIYLLETPYKLESITSYWSFSLHDSLRGSITRICLTFDERFILSTAEDGTFFVFELMNEELQNEEIREYRARIPSSIKPTAGPVEDIDDLGAYSIEEHKQKSEYDKLLAAAEADKTKRRKTLNELRLRFKELRDRNEDFPARLRLANKEFVMVPEIRQQLFREREDRLQLVLKETAWDTEKIKVLFNKLYDRYRGHDNFEDLKLLAFSTEHVLHNIRGLSFMREHMELRDKIVSDTDKVGPISTADIRRKLSQKQTPEEIEVSSGIFSLIKGKKKTARVLRMQIQLKMMQQNAERRLKRSREWASLQQIKPQADYEDPCLNKEIENVKNNLGDFKLKSSVNYKVPEGGGLSASRARFHLLELLLKSNEIRQDFNLSVIRHRDHKLEIIEKLTLMNDRLNKIGKLLPHNYPFYRIKIPKMDPAEEPEKLLQFTEAQLNEYDDEINRLKNISTIQKQRNEFLNVPIEPFLKNQFELFEEQPNLVVLEMHDLAQEAVGNAQIRSDFKFGISRPRPEIKSSFQLIKEASNSDTKDSIAQDQSALVLKSLMVVNEQSFYDIQVLLKEQQELLSEAGRLVRCFDARLKILVYSRSVLSPLLKRMELQLMTAFEEFRLLKDFEITEESLTEKKNNRLIETEDIKNKISDVKSSIENKKHQVDKLTQQEQELTQKVLKTIGEDHKYRDFLVKVYRKKIKRKKQEDKDEDEDESESESDDSDSDFDENEVASDDEMEQLDLDTCPPACSPADYDFVINMREKRLDNEELLVEEKRILEGFKKEVETFSKKLKVAENSLKQATNDLEAYQLEKQRRVNEFEVLITVRLDQLLYNAYTKNDINTQLKDSIIFNKNDWQGLRDRIQELIEERKRDIIEKRQTIIHHKLLQKNRVLFQNEIDKTEKECGEMMMKKFGKMVELPKLETIILNPKLEELKEQMENLQFTMDKEIINLDNKIKIAREINLQSLRENTKQVNKMLLLFNEKQTLCKELDKSQTGRAAMKMDDENENWRELKALMQIVNRQKEEIQALRIEILALSSKDGCVIPPSMSISEN